MDTVRIFVGTEEKTEIAYRVLAYSIRKRTTANVEITPMIGPGWEVPKNTPAGTGFSLRRWLIPSKCNFAGKAIYMDADQLVLGDVLELWNMDKTVPGRAGSSAWMTYQPDKFNKNPWPQSSVMLIDCAAASKNDMWHPEKMYQFLSGVDRKDRKYADFMHATWMQPPAVRIPDYWNHLNVYKEGQTRLLHYTKEDAQCWYNPSHPLAYLWRQELQEAIKNRMVDRELYETALSKWNVKQDWRKSNGLHPLYKKYLPLFDEVKR